MAGPAYQASNPVPTGVLLTTARCEILGYSAEGRPLTVQFCGSPDAALRIFIIAGQHGDEPETRQAAAEFVSRFRDGTFRAAAHAAVLVDANPDGAIIGTRRNAQGTDLNRDHLLLSSPEISSVHAFLDSWKPDLVIDVHTYRPWRRELTAFDFVFPQEIMIDFPTNPAVSTSMGLALQREILSFMNGRLEKCKVRSDRYTIIRSGIVRHSSTDIVDARNGLALRFDIPTILIEGRRSSPYDSVRFTPPAVALLHSVELAVEWVAGHAKQLSNSPFSREAREMIPVRCRYSGSRTVRQMEMQSAVRGEITQVRIPGSYLPRVRATRNIRLPMSYGVPRNMTETLALLGRHRMVSASHWSFGSAAKEAYRIEAMSPAKEGDATAIFVYRARVEEVKLDEFVLFPVEQTGGRLMALLLEPESQFGPIRLPELTQALLPNSTYPIIRVL
jgi:hypothetical protein